jgi:hypothetical protein
MKPLLVCLFISVGIVHSVFGQQDSVIIPDPNRYENHFHFYSIPPLMGLTFTNYPAMREVLKKQGISYPSFGRNVGIGLALQKKHWKAGFISEYSLITTSFNQQQITKVNMVSTNVHAGYAFYYGRNLEWFFNIGIGGISTNLTVQKTQPSSSQAVSINTLFANPLAGYSPNLFHKNTFGEISIERTYRPKRPMSFNANFKLGYRVGINKAIWTTDNAIKLSDSPSDRMSQVFIQSIFVVSKNREKETKVQREARRKKNADNDWGLNPR